MFVMQGLHSCALKHQVTPGTPFDFGSLMLSRTLPASERKQARRGQEFSSPFENEKATQVGLQCDSTKSKAQGKLK
jgi:hypothetical protein